MSTAKPTPLIFAQKTKKKISINDFQEYQNHLQDKEQLKELIKKFSLQNILDLMNIICVLSKSLQNRYEF